MTKVVLAGLAQEDAALIGAALEGAGHTVLLATDADSVLREAPEAAVIVADVAVAPEGLGALIDRLRQTGQTPRPEVLAVCEAEAIDLARQAVEKGAYDYCLRPVQLERLLTKVDLAIRRSGRSPAPSPAGQPERRAHPRHRLASPVQVVIDGITLDISAGGMRVAAPVQMPDDLVIAVVSEFISQLIGTPGQHVRARIVHHHRLNGKYVYGVRFIDLTPDIREAIRAWAGG